MLFQITTFTVIHTLLSIVGIFAGLVLAGGWISGRQLERWSVLFLVTIFFTNLSGFGFPFVVLLPGHIIGAISLVLLPFVLAARYWKHLAGRWRTVYVAGSLMLLYFDVFILVVQLFKRIPGLIAAAPTQKEPPFVITQVLVLILFVWLGREAGKGSRTIAP